MSAPAFVTSRAHAHQRLAQIPTRTIAGTKRERERKREKRIEDGEK